MELPTLRINNQEQEAKFILFNLDGPLSKAPRSEDLTVAAVALYQHGHPWHRARELSRIIYAEADEIQRLHYIPRFFLGVREALERLKSTGFSLGVATNGEAGLARGCWIKWAPSSSSTWWWRPTWWTTENPPRT